jgi:hypothetical protein
VWLIDGDDPIKRNETLIRLANPSIVEIFAWDADIAQRLTEDECCRPILETLEGRSITIHVPCGRGVLYCDGSNESRDLMQVLERMNDIYKPVYFVFHPDKVKRFSQLSKTNIPIVLEGMDIRSNKRFQTAEALFPLVRDLYGAIMDSAHIGSMSNDPARIKDFVGGYLFYLGNLVKGFHVSDCDPMTGIHGLMINSSRWRTQKSILHQVINNSSARIIIESPVSPGDYSLELRKEREFILNC